MKRLKIKLNIGFESLALSAHQDVHTHYLGSYASIFKGRGLEFDSYRTYTPDDDASMIDWKVSARADQLMIKQYIEERNMDVFFLVDVSNTMILSSQPVLKCEYAAEVVASLSYTVLKAGDNVGYLLFNEKIEHLSMPRKGLNTYPELIDVLSQSNVYGGGYNLTHALESCMDFLPQGSLMIIVSDFIGIHKGLEDALRLASRKFSLIGVMVRDPLDRTIPEGMGQIAVGDPMGNDAMLVDPNFIKPYYEEEVKKMENYIQSVFMDNGQDFILLQTDTEFIGKFIELFKMREMRGA